MALGVYLRKFVVENAPKEDAIVDTEYLGKFAIGYDRDADYESLYAKRITFTASGLLASIGKAKPDDMLAKSVNFKSALMTRQIDWGRMQRLCRVQSSSLLKSNLEAFTNHLLQVIVGNNRESDTFKGKTVRVNLKIGSLVIANCGTGNA